MGGTEGRDGEVGVQGQLYLNIGLHNGVLLRTVVDQVSLVRYRWEVQRVDMERLAWCTEDPVNFLKGVFHCWSFVKYQSKSNYSYIDYSKEWFNNGIKSIKKIFY